MGKSSNQIVAIIFLLVIRQSVLTTESNNDQIIRDFHYIKKFNISNAISGIFNHNWTENHECLVELNEIRNGFERHEEWASKVLDSYGKFPSGVLNGNFFDTGSFSECFHVEQNERQYETQYCLATLMLGPPEIERNSRLATMGICLPASCAVTHLQSIVNDVIHTNATNVTNLRVHIPQNSCQLEELAKSWSTFDLITIGIFGISLFLLATSTGYDIFCTVSNRRKCLPFIAFSMYTNGKMLFAPCNDAGKQSDTIQCLEGIRVISTIWIIVYHVYLTLFKSELPLRDTIEASDYLRTYRSALISTHASVQSFFAISGLLVSYKMLKLLRKNGKLDILSLYWNRYLRLTPLLGVVILLDQASTSIFHSIWGGPFWPIYASLVPHCKQYWWSALLYIQNIVNTNTVCIPPSWYLSIDMHLYIISPFLVYLIHRFKKTTLAILIASILGCMCYTPVVYVNNNFRTALQPGYLVKYRATSLRFPPWVVGFILGYILFKYPKGSIKIPKKLNLCALSVSVIVLIALSFGNYRFHQLILNTSSLEYGLFEASSRVLWPIALCYIIFACIHNSGGPINWFLSLSMWQTMSKLSYAVYLIHTYVVAMTFATSKSALEFSEWSLIRNSISIIFLCYFVAIPMTLAFELPIDAINKWTAGRKKPNEIPISAPPQSQEKFRTEQKYSEKN